MKEVNPFEGYKEKFVKTYAKEIQEVDIEATLDRVCSYLLGAAYDFQEEDLEKAKKFRDLHMDVALLHYKLLPNSRHIFFNVSLEGEEGYQS